MKKFKSKIKQIFIKFNNKIKPIRIKFNNFIQDCFSSRKKTFKLLAIIVFSILFLIQVSIMLINNSFYTNFSDDILQYYTIMTDFITSLKNGSLSWFNLNNYFGASFFSDIYYIPFDIFTTTTFLLSYLMPIDVAYSVTELIKIFAGVMVFAYYLSLKNYKNRTIFWMSIIYFVSGGSVSFMAFPVFLSLTFYLPLSLVVIHFFMNKKRWILPLFALAIIFYDFYLGYMILAFMSFAFLIEYFKLEKFKWKKLVKDGIIFLSLLLLGVVMSFVILYPSLLFILNQTHREVGSFYAWNINLGSLPFDIYKPGLGIQYLIDIVSNKAVLGFQFSSGVRLSHLGTSEITLKLFRPEIYVRYLAKIFVEQKPIGFYGFENNYGLEHISLYITLIGFVYMCNIFFMKDRISKVYKYTVLFAVIFMFFPIFSYVFSGTLDVPYTRWINMLPLIEVMILAHVFDQKGFEQVRVRNMIIIISVLLAIGGFLIYYYIMKLNIDTRYYSRDVLTADTIFIGIALGILTLLLIFFIFKKYTIIKWLFWIEFVIAIGYIYSGPFSIANKITQFRDMHNISVFLEDSLHDDSQFYRVYVDISDFDVQSINFNRMTTYPTNTDIFHSWTDSETNALSKMLFAVDENQSKNKMNYFGYYLSNFLGYKYMLVNANDDFTFDDKYFTLVNESGIYQLYEINGVTPFKVYDSYIPFETFSRYCLNNSNIAAQKVLLRSAISAPLNDDETERFDMSKYDLNRTSPTADVTQGSVSAAYAIYPDSTVMADSLNSDGKKQFNFYDKDTLDVDFNVGAIYMQMNSFYLSKDENANYDQKVYHYSYSSTNISVGQYAWVKFPTIVVNANNNDDFQMNVSLDNKANYYYVYIDGKKANPKDFSNKLVRLQFDGNKFIADTNIEDFGETYVVFSDGSTSPCQFFENQEFQIKCEFWKQPVGLYVEDTNTINPNYLTIRPERAIDRAAYLVFDLKNENIPEESGFIQFTSSPAYSFQRIFVVDDQGNQYECLDGFLSYSDLKFDKLYIYKTNDMYNNSYLFNMRIKYTFDDLSDSDTLFKQQNIENESLTINKGLINLSYNYDQAITTDNIVMIPVVYSEEWIITNDVDYDTISISGGFLGIVIPKGTESVDVTLKFEPDGVTHGAYGSLVGVVIYVAIFAPALIKKRKKVSEVKTDETS